MGRKISYGLILVSVCLALVACGGGGGGGTPAPVANTDWDQITWDKDNWN